MQGTTPVVVNDFSDHGNVTGLGTGLEEDNCTRTRVVSLWAGLFYAYLHRRTPSNLDEALEV